MRNCAKQITISKAYASMLLNGCFVEKRIEELVIFARDVTEPKT